MGFPSTYDVYVFFFVSQPLHHHLSNNVCTIFLLKSYQTLDQWENSENNRTNIVFYFSYNVYKENARNFLQFVCAWLEVFLIPRASSAFKICFNLSLSTFFIVFICPKKFHINAQQGFKKPWIPYIGCNYCIWNRLEALKTTLVPLMKNGATSVNMNGKSKIRR